jgi:hypothetical protein
MSSSVRDITESTEAEGRDDTHHSCHLCVWLLTLTVCEHWSGSKD